MTQRVVVVPEYGERRDAVDQRWARFLAECGLLPLLVPNDRAVAERLATELPVAGVLLTGGNDPCELGGDAPERDETERALLGLALERRVPVMGVCRGMQMIQSHWGVKLEPVAGHVTADHIVAIDGQEQHVNSYHRFAAMDTVEPLRVWARAADGVVEAVRHESAPVVGLMWHPERFPQFRRDDIELFQSVFGEAAS